MTKLVAALGSQLRGTIMLVILLRMLAAISTFAFASILGFIMAKAEYGAIATLISVSTFFGTLAALGQRELMVREVSVALTVGDRLKASALVAFGTLTSITGGLILATSLTLFWIISGKSALISVLSALFVIFLGANNAWQGVGRAYGHVFWAVAPRDVLWRTISITILVFFFFAASGQVTELEAIYCLLAVLIVLVSLQGLVIMHKAELVPKAIWAPMPYLRGDYQRLIGSTVYFTSTTVGGIAFATLDVIVVDAIVGSEAAAEYFPANRVALMLSFFYLSVQLATGPEIARLHALKDNAGIQRVAKFAALAATIPAVVLLALLMGLSDYLPLLFPTASQTTVLALIILGCAQLAGCALGIGEQLLNLTGHDAYVAKLMVISVVVGVAAIVLGTYIANAIGAAAGVAIVTIARKAIITIEVKRRLNIRPTVFESIR